MVNGAEHSPSTGRLRVLLVDDSPDFLEAARKHLAAQPWIELVGQAGDGAEAVALSEALKPDLVLMDVAMPGLNGIEATRRIRRLPDAPRVIMLSLHEDEEYRRHAREAGAEGYLPKSQFPHLLPEVVCRLFGPDRRRTAQPAQPEPAVQTLAAAVEQTADTVLITNREGTIGYVNPAFERVTGYRREEAVGRRPNLVKSGEHPPEFYRKLWDTILAGAPFRAVFINRRKDGSLYHEQKTITPIKDRTGRIMHFVSTGKDITEQMVQQTLLRQSEERFRATFEQAAVGIAHVSPGGDWLRANQKLCDIVGYPREELLRKTFQDITHPDDLAADLGYVRQMLAGEISSYTMEKRYFRKDGQVVWINLTVALVRRSGGEPDYFISVIEDITERKRIEESYQDSEARLRALVDAAPECVKLMKADGTLIQINPAGLVMIEADSAEAVVGQCVFDLVAPEYRDRFQAFVERAAQGERGSLEFEIVGLKGTRRWLDTHAVPFRSRATNGTPLLVAVTRDITKRKHAERDLVELAHHDALTGLPNRLLFTDRLRQAMVEARRHERLVGVALLDLDQFKKINDTLGHTTGDVLLVQVGERLRAALRAGDTIARLGGDEFTLVLTDMAHVDDATTVLQKIQGAFEEPFQVDGREFFVTASIGITLFPFDDQDVQALLRNADIAMYRAKESGRNTWQFYAAEMTAKASESLTIENELRGAIERGELELHYQPQVSLTTGRVTGVEALLRWNHPRLGAVAPDRFIPIAEEVGLIVPIGVWVLRTACKQAQHWHQTGSPSLRVAVNLSARQCREPDFTEAVRWALTDSGLPPEALELEVTESLLLRKIGGTATALEQLDALGVRFTIDDFGTGYSSLSYLKRLPIDALKIDRSFVRDIADDPDDAAIVRAIITMAGSLGIEVVAEGVETLEQLNFLQANGCDLMQGYYFSKPQPAAAITQMLRDGKTLHPCNRLPQGGQ
jgi:diguanylate cyclase (GGDEF)-like protein/PAS domain S-box-containing protein